MESRKEKSGKRERRFNDAEKCELVDITCNEKTTNADGDQDEPVLVKLRSKTISNKEKTSLYRSVAEQLAGRGYESRNPKGIKRMWNLLFSDYIQAKDVLKTKSEVKALKTSPWVNTIAEGIKRCEIEAGLEDLVLDSTDFHIVTTGYVFHCCLQRTNVSVRISFRFLYYFGFISFQ